MSADIISAAKSFQVELRERSGEIEAGRQLPADIAARFAEAGFYRTLVPRDYHGLEADPIVLARVIETLAEADGSASWCVMIGATTGVMAGSLPRATAEVIYGRDANVITCGVFARRGKAEDKGDHFIVNGRWQWGSSSPNAQWISGGCLVTKNGELDLDSNGVPRNGGAFVPIKDAELLGNWDVSGLSGSGSQDFAMRELKVPRDFFNAEGAARTIDRALYRFPFFGLLGSGIAAAMLGLAKAAIDEAINLAGGKTPESHRRVLAQRSRTQEDVAQAEAMRRAARAFFYEMLESAWAEVGAKGRVSLDTRRDLRMAITHAARECVKAVDLMYALGGGTSVYKTSPLQRIFRDIHVAAQHMMVAPPTMETAGRLLLGVDADTSTF
ncbi:MAG: flavin-dependent monooxygenase [Alphaproteobacteria bacterium]|nr:flavin-dependent monooxygenase [Alphaproteobacteria bacterium]